MVDLHLIGHSRGSVVITEATQTLRNDLPTMPQARGRRHRRLGAGRQGLKVVHGEVIAQREASLKLARLKNPRHVSQVSANTNLAGALQILHRRSVLR